MSSKYKNPSFTKKYKKSFIYKKYKNPSFTKKYKNPIVLSKHDGVDWPGGITFNNDFTKLFIINNRGKSVLVYSCK
jgi:hypothetical protein